MPNLLPVGTLDSTRFTWGTDCAEGRQDFNSSPPGPSTDTSRCFHPYWKTYKSTYSYIYLKITTFGKRLLQELTGHSLDIN